MSARAKHADQVRWERRIGLTKGMVSDAWASSKDVVVHEQGENGHLLWTVTDIDQMPSHEVQAARLDSCGTWSTVPTTHDDWMGDEASGAHALHLQVPPAPKGATTTVRCRWARSDPRPLLVHLHVAAGQTVMWYDETVSARWQRTARVWHVGDGAQVRLSNSTDDGMTEGAVWWDDSWELAPFAQAYWLDHLGASQDVRRRSQVHLQEGAVWKMASVGWLLPQRWHDHGMTVHHHGVRSESHLHHRTVLLDRSQRRLTSCVVVDPQAVDGFTAQTMQHWLLGDPVTLAASPQLAIGVGALRGATHGAAVGRFDPHVVQAMRGRGLPLAVALRLTLGGALRDALDRLDDGTAWWNEQRLIVEQRLLQERWLQAAQAFWDRSETLDKAGGEQHGQDER